MTEIIFERLKISGKRIEVLIENVITSILWHCDMEGCLKVKHGTVIEDATLGNYLMVITDDYIEVYRLMATGDKVKPLHMVRIPYGAPVTDDIIGNRKFKRVLTIVKMVMEAILDIKDTNETKGGGDVFVERV